VGVPPMSPPTMIRVELAGRSYDILVGSGLLAGAGAPIRERIGGRRLVVLTRRWRGCIWRGFRRHCPVSRWRP
jgi:hypothetical protein